jgi:DNA-directed RNA polymerase subunit omega
LESPAYNKKGYSKMWIIPVVNTQTERQQMKTKSYGKNRTAGLTSEAAVNMVGNRYDMILIASNRMREISRGDAPRVEAGYSPATTALMEIEAGLVGRDYLYREPVVMPKRKGRMSHTIS